MSLAFIRRYWFLGLGCLVIGLAALYAYLLANDCPPSICRNPIRYNQRRANSAVTYYSKSQGAFFLENKQPKIPTFLLDRCFVQDSQYIFVCQTIDIESAQPAFFSYAFSRRNNLKSYAAGTFIVKTATGGKIAQSIICEAKTPGTDEINRPINAQTCAPDTIAVEEEVIP